MSIAAPALNITALVERAAAAFAVDMEYATAIATSASKHRDRQEKKQRSAEEDE